MSLDGRETERKKGYINKKNRTKLMDRSFCYAVFTVMSCTRLDDALGAYIFVGFVAILLGNLIYFFSSAIPLSLFFFFFCPTDSACASSNYRVRDRSRVSYRSSRGTTFRARVDAVLTGSQGRLPFTARAA